MIQIPTRMNYTFSAFQEPRGVMRIFQLIFAIAAFATTTNFVIKLTMTCNKSSQVIDIDYPFSYSEKICNGTDSRDYYLPANVSSDAQFFVATGVLSLMYCIFIIVVYAAVDELYRTKTEIPLADFMLTTILAIFWLSGSAAWSNGTSALKVVTDVDELRKRCPSCIFTVSSFSRLNISLLLGFLNFFLWASDLWFLYKETIWFQSRSGGVPGGQTGIGVPSGSMQPNIN